MLEEPDSAAEHLGWRTLRPPPASGLIFGALYGAIAGAFIAWDVAVLIRFGRAIRERRSSRRQ